MRRFLLFLYDGYGVGGGWLNFENDYNNIEEARERAEKSLWTDYHIVDWKKREIIEEGFVSTLRRNESSYNLMVE